MKITKKTVYSVEDFNLQFEPITGSISILPKKDGGFMAKYLVCDEEPMNPRDDDRNFGKMVCFHKRYNLGDKTDFKSDDYNSWNELAEAIKKEGVIVIFPLYLYDHSGLSIKIGDFYSYPLPQGHAYFDSGQIGFVYLTKKRLEESSGISKEKAIEYVKDEVETYNDYLRGDCYSCVVETFDKEKNSVDFDIVSGFIGHKRALEALKKEF